MSQPNATPPSAAGPNASPDMSLGNGRGIALVLGAFLVFGIQDGITKHITQSIDVAQMLLVRFGVFALFVTFWVSRRRGIRTTMASKRPVFQIFRSALILAEIGIFATALKFLPLADVHSIFAAAPLIVTALSVPLLGEPVGPRRWAAVLVGFCGVLVILRPGMGVIEPAALLALLAGFMFALYIVLTRKVSAVDSTDTSLFYMGWTGFVIMAMIGPFYWQWPDLNGWLFLGALSLTSIVGHMLFTMALEASPAAILQPFQYSVLVWAALIGFFAFGDIPDFWTIIGASVVVASGLYTIYRERVRGRIPKERPMKARGLPGS